MTDLDEALRLLRRQVPAADLEDDHFEVKQEGRNLKETLEIVTDAVVCFANATGGKILIGVTDRPAADPLPGVSPSLTTQAVVRGVFDRTRPPLSVPVDEISEGSKRLLLVSVPAGAVHYANAKGVATLRVGNECRPFTPEQQRQALSSRGLYDWSAVPAGVGLEGVAADAMAALRSTLARIGQGDLSRSDDATLLTDMRLLTEDRILTRAGCLLVASEDEIARAIPQYGYAYQYRPAPGAEPTARHRGRRPLLAAIERLLDLVDARRTSHPLNLAGGVEIQLDDFSARVVRELVVNALVHRDYEFDGAVDVEHTPEQLSVTNPGGLVFGVTPANILSHPSTPRNRLLLETITFLRIAERAGQGVDRVYRELLRAGKPPPSYADEQTRVIVTVAGGTGNDTFVRFVDSALGEPLTSDLEVLLALSHLRHARAINADQLAPLIQRRPADAQLVLDRMHQHGLLEPSRRTARNLHPRYALSPKALAGLGRAVEYHRRDNDEVETKVVEHVQEYGYVTNPTLRRMFDLNVYAARDLLRDLQRRGTLVKIGEQTSGPGVRYGLGGKGPDR